MKPLPPKLPGVSYIYGLVDPRINKVRYVGEALYPTGRLAAHFSAPELAKTTYRAKWVGKLFRLGLRPRMVVLEKCDVAVWQARETWWIAYYRRLNGNLMTNATDGGEGWHGMKHSEAERSRNLG